MNQEIIQEWASETLEKMNKLLPENQEEITRVLHSIKGTAGFLELHKFVELAHLGEETISNSSPNIALILEEIKERLTQILTPKGTLQDPYLRVRKDLLDQIFGWGQELALMRNELGEHVPDLLMQRLARAVNTLQETTIKLQMGFLSYFLREIPQMVKDSAKELKKKINFQLTGTDAEVSREVLASLKQPLYHILRNSIDHGIEPPEIRKRIGKKEEGQINLTTHRSRTQIHIEIIDDGAGINLEKIKHKLAKTIGEQPAQNLSKEELLNALYQPGFTTENKVTNLSGRGIGMDVVKTTIERFHGKVKITTEKGKYTKVKITLPVNRMITPIISFLVGHNQAFTLPAQEIVKIIEVKKEQIENFNNLSFLKTATSMVPIIDLEKELQIDTDASDSKPQILIVCGDSRLCLYARKILHYYDTLIYPVPATLDHIKYIKGVTISQKGELLLLLDLNHFTKETIQINSIKKKEEPLQSVLLIQTQENLEKDDSLLGIATEKVHYIGKLDKVIEHKGQMLFQHKGELREIIPLSDRKPKHFAAVDDSQKTVFLGFEKAISTTHLRKDKEKQMIGTHLVEILKTQCIS